MGYDMYQLGAETPEEQFVREAAKDAFDAACRARGDLPRDAPGYAAAQAVVEQAHDLMSRADVGYYRLNVWGMSAACEVMWRAGMLKKGHYDEWPERPDNVSEEAESLLDEVDDNPAVPSEVRAAYVAWLAASVEHRTRHDRDTPGIGENKFSSNDGWIVTPFECLGAVGMWDRLSRHEQDLALLGAVTDDFPLEDVRTWFEGWVAWLRRARDRGGFEVW